MTTLDIVILIVFVAAVAWGFRKGIIMQMGALGGIVAGVVACRLAASWLATEIAGCHGADGGEVASPSYVDIVLANVILFIAALVCVKLVAGLFKRITHALCLGALDRIAGALFCLFEWMMVLSLMVNLWLVIKPKADFHELSTIGNGHAIEAIVNLAPMVLGYAMGQ